MQDVWARRQFEHGICLSHRTFRRRHVIQLRGFRALETAAAGGYTEAPGGVGVLAKALPSVWGRPCKVAGGDSGFGLASVESRRPDMDWSSLVMVQN
jgi:hypothetical protein